MVWKLYLTSEGKDLWLTETFATYWAKRFEEHIFGEDYHEEVRNKELAETLEAALHDNYAVGHYMGGRNRWYPKGSLVMDMLRDVLGDENFRIHQALSGILPLPDSRDL